GVVAGAPIGAWLSNRIQGRWILRGLALALASVGLRLLIARWTFGAASCRGARPGDPPEIRLRRENARDSATIAGMHAPPRPPFERYVAIGDSSTEGIDDPDGQGGYRGWSQRLAERIPLIQGTLLYAKLGVRGRTTRQIRDQQLAPALAMQPDLARVFSGTNDVLARRFDAEAVGRD